MKENKVKYCHSMSFKIQLLLAISLIFLTVILEVITIPRMTTNIRELTQDYMISKAKSCGLILETKIEAEGEEFLDDNQALDEVMGSVSISGYDSSYAYLVDKNGNILYHPSQDKISEQVENQMAQDLAADVRNGNTVQNECKEYVYNGVPKYSSFYVANDKSFIVIVTVDEKDVFANISNLTVFAVMMSIILIIVVVIIAILMVRRMLKPLHDLTNSVN